MATSEELKLAHRSVTNWRQAGDHWVWLNALAITLSIIAVAGILVLLAWRGFANFWPADLWLVSTENQRLLGEVVQTERLSRRQYQEASDSPEPATDLPEVVERWLLKTGNRRVAAPDFRWVAVHQLEALSKPEQAWVIERTEWGNALGWLESVTVGGTRYDDGMGDALAEAVDRMASIRQQIRSIKAVELARINGKLEQLSTRERQLANATAENVSKAEQVSLEGERTALAAELKEVESRIEALRKQADRDYLELRLADGRSRRLALDEIVRAWQPNRMSTAAKVSHALGSIWIFLTDEPREANTEGGVFPAIFGTVLMVLLMAVLVTPFGVMAAIYLHEYARQGPFVQLMRIAINNLAGVPSIVYGVFGLGFFVYFLGGSIDQLFFADSLPAPTFGTPGILWASLTLALLTVPVVIVATEEGLARIPRRVREGSLALGATRAETLFRIVLPMASPAILTGVILAVARAAGEVAPLMLVGVVKLAPSLPLDGNFPFLHLDRKFMHLGFHIYDVGFQSPNVEAARPLVFATALLLVVIVLGLNLLAIVLRNRLEIRYRGYED